MQPLPVPLIVTAAVRLYPGILEHLSEASLGIIKAAGYDGIRTVMYGEIFGAVFGYLSGGSIASARSRMSVAVSRAYIETAEAAYVEAGAELPLDDDTAAWARERLDEQLAYVDALFEDLREIRKQDDFDAGAIASARAEGYSQALDSYFSEIKMMGNKNQLLTWVYGDADHCKTCESLNGQKHRASWYIDRNYIPGKPGADMDCGGYRCACVLVDRDGNEVTI